MSRVQGMWRMKKAALQELWVDLTGEPVDPSWTVAELREYLKQWAREQTQEDAQDIEDLKGLASLTKEKLRERGQKMGLEWSHHTTRGKMIIDIKEKVANRKPASGSTPLGFGRFRLCTYSQVWIQNRQYAEWVVEEKESQLEEEKCSPKFLRFYHWIKSAPSEDKMSWKPDDSRHDSMASAKKGLIRNRDGNGVALKNPKKEEPTDEPASASSGGANIAAMLGTMMAEIKTLGEQVKDLQKDRRGQGLSEDSEGWAKPGSPSTPASPPPQR